MNTFESAFKNASHLTETENGALALNTTSDPCLDLYATIGALRGTDSTRIETLIEEAYKVDPLLTTKIIFYARDIRGGLGERDTFRIALRYLANKHPEAIQKNIWTIGDLYGRYDDLYYLIDTPLEPNMWHRMGVVLSIDLNNMSENKPVSLLAKWIKTPDASSENTRKLGILTAKKLGYSVYNFKRKLRALRKYLKVVETKMSANKWTDINYAEVPSKAMTLYRNSFVRHDPEGFDNYIQKVNSGEEKINSSTLYPYDLIRKYEYESYYNTPVEDPIIEAQWKALPNYIFEGVNAIVMADTSASMTRMNRQPLFTSISLALYFAQRNTGAYHNLWMSFSTTPNIHEVKGSTLYQMLYSMDVTDWKNSTNIEAAMYLILGIALKSGAKSSELPKALIIISDMEFDKASRRGFAYDEWKEKYSEYGYELPNIIFWNVYSRQNTFHVPHNQKGVQLISGSSASSFKNVIDCINMTPREAMLKVINSERYDPITIS